MDSQKKRPVWQIVVAVIGLLGIWWLFAPVQLGGKTAYVIVAGTSMEPTYQLGDLVITRDTDSYQVGDVVAYYHAFLEEMVIHRLVSQKDAAWTLQGDNNDFKDTYFPTDEEIIGEEWIYLPGMGSIVQRLRQPGVFAGIVGVFILLLVLPDSSALKTEDEADQDRKEFKGQVHFMGNKERTQEFILTFGVVGLVALVAVVVGFSKPVSFLKESNLFFTHHGSFGYSATGDPDIYDTEDALTGDIIFRKISDQMLVNFDYQITDLDVANYQASAQMVLQVKDEAGWVRTFEMLPETAFTGTQVQLEGEINFEDIEEVTRTFERLTGVDRPYYYFEIIPIIQIQGKDGDKPVKATFSPHLRFVLGDLEVRMVVPGDFTTDAILQPEEIVSFSQFNSESNTIDLFSLKVPIGWLRGVSLVLLVASLGLMGWYGYQHYQVLKQDGAAAVAYKYGELVIEVNSKPANSEMEWIERIEDLVKMASKYRVLVMHLARRGYDYYYIKLPEGYYYSRLDPSSEELAE